MIMMSQGSFINVLGFLGKHPKTLISIKANLLEHSSVTSRNFTKHNYLAVVVSLSKPAVRTS